MRPSRISIIILTIRQYNPILLPMYVFRPELVGNIRFSETILKSKCFPITKL